MLIWFLVLITTRESKDFFENDMQKNKLLETLFAVIVKSLSKSETNFWSLIKCIKAICLEVLPKKVLFTYDLPLIILPAYLCYLSIPSRTIEIVFPLMGRAHSHSL